MDFKVFTANRSATGREVFVNGKRFTADRSQQVYLHSPDGFEWGYGGSGPSQLSLAILLEVLDDESEALKYYNAFKWRFIATALADGFAITSPEIIDWYIQIKEDESSLN